MQTAGANHNCFGAVRAALYLPHKIAVVLRAFHFFGVSVHRHREREVHLCQVFDDVVGPPAGVVA